MMDARSPSFRKWHVDASLRILRFVAESATERAYSAGEAAGCAAEKCDRAARIAYPYATSDTDVADTTNRGANRTNRANCWRNNNIIVPAPEEQHGESRETRLWGFIRTSASDELETRIACRREKERRSSSDSARRPSLDSIGRNDGESEPATNPPRRPSFGMNDNGDGSRGLRPLEPVAERKSEYGFDGVVVNPGGPPPPEASNNVEADTARGTQPGSEPTISSQPQPPTLQHPQARKELAPGADPVKRYSTSPTLPMLSRLSGFGGDFLGLISDSSKGPNPPADSTPEQPQTSSIMAGSVNDPAARNSPSPSTDSAHPTPQPGTSEQASTVGPSTSEPAQTFPIRPSLPGGWVTETVTPAEMATPGSEEAKYGSDLSVKASDVPPTNEHPVDVHMHPAPLRTPSPGDTNARHAGDESQHDKSSRESPANVPSFRKSPSPQPDTERSASQEALGGATLAKDNHDKHEQQPTHDVDALGIAPLQPRKGSAPESTLEDLRPPIMRVETYSTMDNSSPLKESDFLRDEIMRSLSPARPAGDGFQDMPRDENADRESAYLSDVYGDYWSGDDNKPESTTNNEQRGRDTGEPESTPTIREEPGPESTLPAPSWDHEAPTTAAEPTAAPAVEPETAKPDLNRDRFSWEKGTENNDSDLSSPTKTSLPQSLEELTSAISAGPPDLALPTLNFEESNSRVVSAISTAPPGHRYSRAESPSPISNTGDRDGPRSATGEQENKFFHPEDKVLLQSPMSPMSPMEPIGGIMDNIDPPPQETQRPFTPTEATPEGVPLPRSPSPTKPRSQPAYNSMTLKQIQQLPTSGDRVLKMQETREHFAELDSGLSEWLAEMCTHSQHENAMPTYNYALSGADAELWDAQRGRDEYTVADGTAGTKGKELFHSAGKLSKGLLSKGKNKLRERAESKKA
ncbi:hypothetical protein VMCG_01739 [Cytospora schulzeri]|uniref:Uncharacterized protein n=1 Tax=Cytospora schulzeri TaxID=448051 RepID=A0A423X360_9PEZI|nr:hypothetical protein VMCG_01739 [Valsa malicola]